MGRLALSHEIDRARRSDGRFVLAFVDVDRLKAVNDRDGHAAGDRVLQSVVRTIRARLRSFDPIIRYGGDEFVCGLSGTDLAEAKRRFDSIGVALEADASVASVVGFAALSADDTADLLTERADAAMLEVKASTTQGSRAARDGRSGQLRPLAPRLERSGARVPGEVLEQLLPLVVGEIGKERRTDQMVALIRSPGTRIAVQGA